MLKAVGKIAEEFNVPAELSMDEHMCCGVGVCLTCVIPVKTGDGWEYQRTCTEGPVFDSRADCVGGGEVNCPMKKHRTFNIERPTESVATVVDVGVRC